MSQLAIHRDVCWTFPKDDVVKLKVPASCFTDAEIYPEMKPDVQQMCRGDSGLKNGCISKRQNN